MKPRKEIHKSGKMCCNIFVTCLILALYKLNKSRAGDAIWPHGYLSTLVQVMACCLMAPSHYLNQWCVNAMVINWQGILSKRTFYGSFHFVVPQMMQTSRSWIIVCFGWFLTPWWPGVFLCLYQVSVLHLACQLWMLGLVIFTRCKKPVVDMWWDPRCSAAWSL